MKTAKESFDYIIIGGGIFGCYAALYLAEKNFRVALLEKESEPFQRASQVNQARLHGGYHYPRSIATAELSDEHKARFAKDHAPFINSKFKKFYAIDKYSSLTDAAQFERFCGYLNLPCQRIHYHKAFKFDQIEALFETIEHSFDPLKIAQYYCQRMAKTKNLKLFLNTYVKQAAASHNVWELQTHSLGNEEANCLATSAIINATYASINGINQIFGLPGLDLQYEISEIALIHAPRLQNIGLTIMDGQFGSIMPYGLSELHSLSSVAYTHQKISYDRLPTFDCQLKNNNCRPDFLDNCNHCQAQPRSNASKMIKQMRRYLADEIELEHNRSLYTIKSKLKANHIDDGRPTEITLLNEQPKFYCLFAGKINSIYEVERIL